jgi:hypothetical protein
MTDQLIRYWGRHPAISGLTTPPTTVFLPSSIAGLQFWVRADLGITMDGSNNVSNWADQSGNGRDLTAATTARPLFVTNLINGMPAVRFNGTANVMKTGSFTTAQPLTFFIVLKNVAWTDGKRVLSSDTGANDPQILQRGTGSGFTLQSNLSDGPQVTGAGTTNYHYLKAIFNGTSSKLSIDGGSDATSGNNLANSMTFVWLGSDNSGDFSNVEIAEAFLYNSAITGANLTNVNSYLHGLYGL